jgi:hypothetical protein
MSRKSSSFLFPFSLAFIVSLVVGLSVLYFGYYHPQKEHCRTVMAQISELDQVAPPSEMMIDDSGVQRGKSMNHGSPGKTQGMEIPSKATSPQGKADRSGHDSRMKASLASNKTKPNDNKGKTGSSSQSSQSDYSDDESEGEESFREPAFPKTQSGDSNMEEVSDTDSPPSIDDPEMEENPLLRALKMARERNEKEGDQRSSDSEPPKNPFEFLFNQNDQSE